VTSKGVAARDRLGTTLQPALSTEPPAGPEVVLIGKVSVSSRQPILDVVSEREEIAAAVAQVEIGGHISQ